MAVPIAVGMLFQTLYCWWTCTSCPASAMPRSPASAAAGNATFMVMALTQMLGVGTVTLISHAVGRKDQPDANLVFNQSFVLSAICGGVTLGAATCCTRPVHARDRRRRSDRAGGHQPTCTGTCPGWRCSSR